MLDMLASNLDKVAVCAPAWGFALIFLFMAVESSFIPFPSEIVMIPAGFMAARGELTFHSASPDVAVAVLAGLSGSLAGAYVNYFLAAWLGEPFLRKHGKWFFLKPAALDRAVELFNRYGNLATFVCRVLPAIRQLISIPAGIAKMPLGPFTFFTGLGAGIWTAVLAFAGFWMGRTAGDISYPELVHRGKAYIDGNLAWVLAAVAMLAIAHVVMSKCVMKGKNPKKTNPAKNRQGKQQAG